MMHPSTKILLIVWAALLGFLLVLVGMGMLMNGPGFGSCSSQITEKIVSPNHKEVAYVIERDCGATAGSMDLAIEGPGKTPKKGNVFSCEYSGFQAHWMSSHELVISYPKNAEVYTQKTKIKGISINYVVTPSQLGS